MFYQIPPWILFVHGPKSTSIYDFKEKEVYKIDYVIGGVLQKQIGRCLSEESLNCLIASALTTERLSFQSNTIDSYCNELVDKGILVNTHILQHIDKGDESHVIFDDSHLHDTNIPPTTASIELTKYCNFRCRHCYMESIYKNSEKEIYSELSLPVIGNFLNQLKKIGINSLIITGGEPFLCSNIESILTTVSSYCFPFVRINSNGSLLTKDIVKLIGELGYSLLISVYGMSHDTYKHFAMSSNVFTQVMQGISFASENKSLDLTVTMNICQNNFLDLNSFLKFCSKNEIKNEVGQFLASGRAASCIGNIHLSKDQRLRYGTVIHENRKNTKRPFRRRSCDMSQIAILSNGNVAPCILLQAEFFTMGNILETNVLEIWNSARFKQYRRQNVDRIIGCRDCEDKYICGGGCAAEKFTYWGTINAPHPYCHSDSAMNFFEKNR